MSGILYSKHKVYKNETNKIIKKLRDFAGDVPISINALNKEADKPGNTWIERFNGYAYLIITTGLKRPFGRKEEGYAVCKKTSIEAGYALLDIMTWAEVKDLIGYESSIGPKTRVKTRKQNDNVIVADLEVKQTVKEIADEIAERTNKQLTIVSQTKQNNKKANNTKRADNIVGPETELIQYDEPTDEPTSFSEFFHNEIKSISSEDYIPDNKSLDLCIANNQLAFTTDELHKFLSRLLYLEWTDWLAQQLNFKQIKVNGCFVIDTGLLKPSGETVLMIVNVKDNLINYAKLDAGLSDFAARSLNETNIRNARLRQRKVLTTSLSKNNVDFGNMRWKKHILVERRDELMLDETTTDDECLSIVVESVRRAVALEARGVMVKRLVRSRGTSVGVVVPLLRYNCSSKTQSAIVLSCRADGIWTIVTAASKQKLLGNLQIYNYYDMPSWLDSEHIEIDQTKG